MQDGISKFSHELNRVYLRGTDDDCAPISLPYCLNKMRGDVTGVDTAHEIIANVTSVVASDLVHNTWLAGNSLRVLDIKNQTISLLFLQVTLKLVSW